MKVKRIILVVFSILMVVLLLTGCNEQLESEYSLKKKITNTYENCQFVTVDKIKDSNGFIKKNYTFKNNDFEFVLENYMEESDEPLVEYESSIRINYMSQLLKFKKVNIEKLFEKYNIVIWDASLQTDYDQHSEDWDKFLEFKKSRDSIVCYVGRDMEDEWHSEVDFSFYINKYEDIEIVYNFLTDLQKEFDGHYAKNINYYFYLPHISIDVIYQHELNDNDWIRGETIFSETYWFRTDDFILDDELENMQQYFKENIKE